MRGVWTIVHILGGRSVVPCRKGIHERTQAVHLLPWCKARQSVNRRRFRFRPWSSRDAQRGLRRMRQSGNCTVPAPRRPARLLQRLLQSSGWWRWWWRSLLGQQTGTSAVTGLHHKQETRPQRCMLRACAFSSPWLCVPPFAYSLWKENQYVGGKCSPWVQQQPQYTAMPAKRFQM